LQEDKLMFVLSVVQLSLLIGVMNIAPHANANAGASLVSSNGCEACHGVALKGGPSGPALYGIEKRRIATQIADAIEHPKAPMPNFGFTHAQVGDIVAYLSGLDGGASGKVPIVTFGRTSPGERMTMTVRFPGTPPKHVVALPAMQMGTSTMSGAAVRLKPSRNDPHVFIGDLEFSMGGMWTIKLEYDGKTMNVPVDVGS
jgi:Cytochrome C oxidase, cbb3-type, subunit III